MTTISEFGRQLKAWLRKADDSSAYRFAEITGCDTGGYGYPEVNWDDLDRAIDAFCAEMQAKQPK